MSNDSTQHKILGFHFHTALDAGMFIQHLPGAAMDTDKLSGAA